MIASNIDIDDGLVNGAVATLKYSEWDELRFEGKEVAVVFTTERCW
jgi:hypothetical protein